MSKFWRYLISSSSVFWRKGLLWLICIGYAYGTLYSSISEAAEFQNIDLIKKKVIEDIRSTIDPSEQDRYQIDVQNLDKRLRLSDCGSGIVTKPAKQSRLAGRQSIEVRCAGAKPWKIYLQVSVSIETDIPVLKQPVASGSIISQIDIEMTSITLGADNRPIIEDVNQLIGKKAKRHLSAGIPILISQIEAPNVIQRGQQVNLEYENSGLVVRMSGKSNQDGAEGDWIKVVNLNSGKTIEGRVNTNGNVSVHN